MNFKSFNMGASTIAFFLGVLFIFSDGGAGVTANVIGSGDGKATFTAVIGLFILIGSIALFIVSMHYADNHPIDLERLMRRGNKHEHIDSATPESHEKMDSENP